MKKKIKYMGIIAAMFFCLLLCSNIQANAAGRTKGKAVKAYCELLKKSKIGSSGYKAASKSCEFALAYLDNDSIPELIVRDKSVGVGWVYAYRSGRAKLSEEVVLRNFYYYKKAGIYLVSGYGFNWGGEFYYKFSKGKSTLQYEKNDNFFDGVSYMKGKNRIRITKTEYNRRVKKLIGSRKKIAVKFYKNTKANRIKYLR